MFPGFSEVGGIDTVMDEIPYFSSKRGLPRNYCDNPVSFPGTDEEINCVPLSMHRMGSMAASAELKFDDELIKNRRMIIRNVAPDSRQKYRNLRRQATEVHLFDNGKFGEFLDEQFLAMEDASKKKRLVLFVSTNHVMTFGLRIKEKNGRKFHVIKLIEPSRTTSLVRSKKSSLKTFKFEGGHSYIDGNERLQLYWPNCSASMAFVRPEADELSSDLPAAEDPNRTLTTSIPDKDVDPTIMWYLLTEGFAGNLRQLKETIESKEDDEERLSLLSAKNDLGSSGLCMALQEGQHCAIRAFKELLDLALGHELANLIAARRADGTSGLALALQRGHAGAIGAYAELFHLIPNEQERNRLIVDLLTEKDQDGCTGFYIALQNGHADAVRACKKLLDLLPKGERVNLIRKLLSGNRNDGTPPLFMALQQGDPDTVKAYGELLFEFPEEERADLLAARDSAGNPGLYAALLGRHVDAVNTYVELLDKVPEKEREKILSNNLKIALQKGETEKVEMYIDLLNLTLPGFNRKARSEFLQAIRKSHATQILGIWKNYGFYERMKESQPDLFSKFKSLKQSLDPKQGFR